MADTPKKGRPKKAQGATPKRMAEIRAKAVAAPYRLQEKQRLFAKEYLVDLNGRQAAIRAGYSSDNASKVANRLMKNPDVRAIIDGVIEKRNQRLATAQDQVVAELAKIAFADMADFITEEGRVRDLHDLPPGETSVVSEVQKSHTLHGVNSKVKLHDKLKALELLGRHLGMSFGKSRDAEDGGEGKVITIDLSGLSG